MWIGWSCPPNPRPGCSGSRIVADDRLRPVTEPIYHHDAYVKGFEARVLESGPDGVVLDRTAFYPGGGGQPHDVGRLFWDGREAAVVAMQRGPRHVLAE